MISKRSISALAPLCLAVVLVAGCAHTSNDKTKNRKEQSGVCSWLNGFTGGLIGAGAGTGIGAIVAEVTTGVTMAQGLGVGALSGALIGWLVGDQAQIHCLKEQIAALERERAALEAKLRDCREENAALKAEIERLRAMIAELERRLANTPKPSKEIARISIPNHILFASGSDRLTTQGNAVLDEVMARISRDYPGKQISIEGHTDADPIRFSHWKSNWELGAARSLAVLHRVQKSYGVEGAKLSATTFSEYRPVDTNSTSSGKSANRRTEIVILND